ncbi:hypothetical protein F2Q69_00058782 [Brassica cretica]|uniref:Retrotransposon gag domain-containing protein n=1 Tax=Brassica cretica TaxID=69181 RepID=A0A8S9RLA7_BRACR|nr:hypothetical protein F2Q69_00058782 [Brassica cretica]
MNFTSQRFLIPSICEYPTLEEDSSPMKKRPEENPIIEVERSLSALHKAQDQEKWPRNYEVMIQSPKPAKPVLHLPQLEANWFNQLQTRHWRQGDLSMHSGSPSSGPEESEKSVPCTSNHRIKRILINTNLPYLEHLAFKLQQLFSHSFLDEIRTFQAIQKIPRKLYYPLKPSRFKKNQVSHLEPKSHKRLQRLVSDFVTLLDLFPFLSVLKRSSRPDDYLSWERTMDDGFSYHGVLKKEKLSHAIKQLTGSAYKWWKGVDGARWKSQNEAIKMWEDLKEAMIRKYVSSLPTQEIRERYPRRVSSHGSKEAKRVVPQQDHRSLIHQDQILPNQGHTVFYDQSQPYEVQKTMERKNFVSLDTLARHKEKSDKPIFQEKTKGEQMKAICLLKFQGNNQTISSAMNHLISGSLKLN